MNVGSLPMLLIAIVAALACVVIARRRCRVAIWLAIAVFCGFAAAAEIRVRVGRPAIVAVLVDESDSTRGAWFRDAARARETASRVANSVAPGGEVRYAVFHSDGVPSPQISDADAVLLMSDGRFDSAALNRVPTFPVIDPDARTDDARITGAEADGDRVVVAVINDGSPRALGWPDGTTSAVPHGSIRIGHPAPNDREIVRLNPGDRWPENDSIEIAPAIQVASERWWIGDAPAPAGCRAIAPTALPPTDAWLAAKSVVLDNVSADALDSAAKRALSRYVRDLGGSLTIVGGEHAFSAGGYGGTELDTLSPLASRPPEPRREWLILVDASGSMAAKANDGRSRLDAAIDAAATLANALPPTESVNVASFARELRMWSARDDRHLVAPSDLLANGPTNLRASLDAIVESRGVPAPNPQNGPGTDRLPSSTLPLHLIALTDGDTDLGDLDSLRQSLASANVVIDWLRFDATSTRKPLADLAAASGGSVIDAGDTSHWQTSALAAMHAIEHRPTASKPTAIEWRGALQTTSESSVEHANDTWPRHEVDILAARSAADDPSRTAVAARWRVGEGQVIALAFAASSATIEAAADLIAASPRDPRFVVRWDGERVSVEAADGGAAMNELRIDARDVDTTVPVTPLALVAPGRYAATLPIETRARTMAVRVAGQTIDLHVVSGSPAKEFREIGVDRAALERLAARTGGRVIDRDRPDGPMIAARREQSISAPLLLVSLVALSAAIVFSRR